MLVFETLVRNVFGVWTGTVTFEEHAIGTLLVFLPAILLVHVGFRATGVKELEQLRNLIIAAAIVVMAGPLAIPVGITYGIWLYFFPTPKKAKA